jgi:hypothetical protein
VLLNNGDGTFGAPTSVMTGATPYTVALHYNLDGNTDVAACSVVGGNGLPLPRTGNRQLL